MPITISGDTPNFTSASLSSPVISGTPTGVGVLTAGTSQASTSGTSIDFTGIPSWAEKITVMFAGVSTSGTSNIQIQLGTGSTPTYTTSGYVGGVSLVGSSTFISTGIGITQTTAAATTYNGLTIIANITGNTWCANSNVAGSATNGCAVSGSSIALAAALTAVRITTVNGTDTFDAGAINILYE